MQRSVPKAPGGGPHQSRGVICNSIRAMRSSTAALLSPEFAVRRMDSASRSTCAELTGSTAPIQRRRHDVNHLRLERGVGKILRQSLPSKGPSSAR